MTYTIREFSQKVRLPPSTLRYYEKEGLLPSPKRLSNGHRVYSDADIPRVTLINCLRSTGVSINDLSHNMELCEKGDSTVQERKMIILRQKEKIEAQLEELKKHMELINLKIRMYDEVISKQTPFSTILKPFEYGNGVSGKECVPDV